MLENNFGVLGLVCIFLAAFAAVVSIAMVIVMAKAYLCGGAAEVLTEVERTDVQPVTIGRWRPLVAPAAPLRYYARYVTIVVRNNLGEMPMAIELKEWRLVLALKLRIFHETGIRLTDQILHHGGQRLDDYKELQDYGWKNGNSVDVTLDLVVSL